MTPHRITLRGPWQLTPLARTRLLSAAETEPFSAADPTPAGGRLNPVGEWSPLLGGFRGVVRYERFFNRPTGIDDEPVVLVVDDVHWRADVRLNDKPLGQVDTGATLRVEIRELLEARNCLQVDIEWPEGVDGDHGGLLGGVWLELGD